MRLVRGSTAALIGLLLLGACRNREVEPEPVQHNQQRAAPASPAPQSPAAGAGDRELRFPAPERLVAVGDVHGDLQATRAALRLAGAIGADDRWIGGKLVVVQTGDQLDRGDDEREIVDLFERLAEQARAQGGRVHAMNGNHETMNVQGDFRYVTAAGLNFGPVSPISPLSRQVSGRFQERAQAFLPGGAYAELLSRRNVVLVVGDSAFAHGGILPAHIDYGLGRMNREVSDWMRGNRPKAPAPVTSEDGPVWTRLYGGLEGPEVCSVAKEVLKRLKVRRIIVGHTVQKQGVTSICNESIWRIDVGLAAFYGENPVSVLEVTPEAVRVLSARR